MYNLNKNNDRKNDQASNDNTGNIPKPSSLPMPDLSNQTNAALSSQLKTLRAEFSSPSSPSSSTSPFRASQTPLYEQSPNSPKLAQSGTKRERREDGSSPKYSPSSLSHCDFSSSEDSAKKPTKPLSPTTENKLVIFCQQVNDFKLEYKDRYRYLVAGDVSYAGQTCASEQLITFLRELFFSLDLRTLSPILNSNAILKEKFQLSLMALLKQFLQMDALRASQVPNSVSEDQAKKGILSSHFDNFDNFNRYIESEISGSKKHLMTFRFLFPLAAPAMQLPKELGQDQIQSFINQIEQVFSIGFLHRPDQELEQNQPGAREGRRAKKLFTNY